MSLDRDFYLGFQVEAAKRRQRVREILTETDHPDRDKIIAEFDRNMWDIETGVTQARATWGALSKLQRHVLLMMEDDRYLTRVFGQTFDAYANFNGREIPGFKMIAAVCRLSTVKNLLARKLLESDSPSDPMKRLVLSDYGKFVLKRGRDTAPKGIP